MTISFEKEEMTTLVNCSNALQKKGFTVNFVVTDKGLLNPENKKIYQPEDVNIVSFYRFEGESDPADNSILYAIEAKDGALGLLSDAYGVYADQKISKFMSRVEEISKMDHVHDPH